MHNADTQCTVSMREETKGGLRKLLMFKFKLSFNSFISQVSGLVLIWMPAMSFSGCAGLIPLMGQAWLVQYLVPMMNVR